MYAFVEVVAGLAVAADDVLSDKRAQKVACLPEKRLVVLGQLNL
jgi:hypothetical protein